MIQGKSVLGLITARGGSKGIPGKNIRILNGKPLLAWTIIEAQASAYIDRLVLSTDDEAIANVAKSYKCEVPFLRSKDISCDDTPGIAPVLDAIERLSKYDYCVLLQPTSPLRLAEDINRALEKCVDVEAPMCVTVSRMEKPLDWMGIVGANGKFSPLGSSQTSRRQDGGDLFALNGAVYVYDTVYLQHNEEIDIRDAVVCEMPQIRSVDVDNENDLLYCELLMASRNGVGAKEFSR